MLVDDAELFVLNEPLTATATTKATSPNNEPSHDLNKSRGESTEGWQEVRLHRDFTLTLSVLVSECSGYSGGHPRHVEALQASRLGLKSAELSLHCSTNGLAPWATP